MGSKIEILSKILHSNRGLPRQGNIRKPYDTVEEYVGIDAAVFVPVYITPENKGEWLTHIVHMLSNCKYPVYYGISYPSSVDKWDVQIAETTIVTNTYLVDQLKSTIPEGRILFEHPGFEHVSAIEKAITKFKEMGFKYFIHLEQDVYTDMDMVYRLPSLCKTYNKPCSFIDMSFSNGVPFPDISFFCIDLGKMDFITQGVPLIEYLREGRYFEDGAVMRNCKGYSDIKAPHEISEYLLTLPYTEFKNLFFNMIRYINQDNPSHSVHDFQKFMLINKLEDKDSIFFDIVRLMEMDLYCRGNLAVLCKVGRKVWHYRDSRKRGALI
jgi:hypothetical protein